MTTYTKVMAALAAGLALATGPARAATGAEDTGNNNATPANAQAVDPGTDCFHLLAGYTSTYADIDHYAVAATSGDRLWIATDTGGARTGGTTGRDSVLALIGTDASTVIESDDNDGTGTGGDAVAEADTASAIAGRLVSSTGDHFVRVTSGDTEKVDPYHLLVAKTSATDFAETEGNDSIGTADGPVTCGAAVAGALATSSDIDVYQVVLTAGQLLWVMADEDPERDGTGTNLRLTLLDSTGAAITLQDIDSSGATSIGSPGAESFTYTATTSGNHFVKVAANTSVAGSYRLLIAPSTETAFVYPTIDRTGAGGGSSGSGGAVGPSLLLPLLAGLIALRRRPPRAS